MNVETTFFTSGSTGESKPIVRTEASLLDDAGAIVSAFGDIWSAKPLVVASVRPEHMYGALWRVRAPGIAGSDVWPGVVVSVEELCGVCRESEKILFVTTPSFLENALLHPDFPSLRGRFAAIVTSGSMLRGETALAVAEAVGTCPLEIFGSTETGTVAWRRRAGGEEWTVFDRVVATQDENGCIVVDSPFAGIRPFKMSDRVKFVSGGRFLLLGRADRRVKILERYVSLSEVERSFTAHPFVERVRVEADGSAVPRLGALVVLSGEGCSALASSSISDVSARIRRDLMPSLGSLAFPRKIRFVRAMPVNPQGKTTVFAVRDALSRWCEEPLVTEWSATASVLSARMVFPSDLKCFKGHFPDCPILPGVAQLFFVRHFARQIFADWPDAVTFRRLKFQRLVFPNREVSLEVRRTGAGSFSFLMSLSGEPCSSGVAERSAK